MPWFGTAQLKWYTNSILEWRVHLAFLETSVKAHLIRQYPTIMRGFSNQIYLVYLRTQINFPIGGESVTCRGSKLTDLPRGKKLTNSLGKQQLKLWTRTWSARAPWNRANLLASRRQANDFFEFVFLFLSWKAWKKHLMTSPAGNNEFWFNSPRVSGKQNLLFPLEPVIKCLFFCIKQETSLSLSTASIEY